MLHSTSHAMVRGRYGFRCLAISAMVFVVYVAWQATIRGQVWFGFRGLTPQQQPGSYQGGEMMMKSVFWWRKPEHPEETTDLRQVTDETFHTYGLCPVRGSNSGRSGVKQSELRRNESGAVAHRATAVPTPRTGKTTTWTIIQTTTITVPQMRPPPLGVVFLHTSLRFYHWT